MIKEIYPYALVALIGAFGHILLKLSGLENITENFSIKVWLKKNKFGTLYGIVATVITVILLWSIKELNWASAALAGYAGDSLMKTKFPFMRSDPNETTNISKDNNTNEPIKP
jgi:hypothetical protein